MDVVILRKVTLNAVTTGADLATMARAKWLTLSAAKSTTAECVLYVVEKCVGQTVLAAGTTVAGTSVPAVELNPSFYPVATKGAECAGIVTSLSWADANLSQGYEFAEVTTVSGTPRFFVSGVLNSSQTLSNDPFTKAEIVGTAVSCWNMGFEQGQML
jgi:hypothetical protein